MTAAPLRTTRYPRPRPSPASPTVRAIVDRIHERGYTYPSIAARAGIHEGTVRRVCHGQCSPSVDLVERLAVAVGLQIVIAPANSI